MAKWAGCWWLVTVPLSNHELWRTGPHSKHLSEWGSGWCSAFAEAMFHSYMLFATCHLWDWPSNYLLLAHDMYVVLIFACLLTWNPYPMQEFYTGIYVPKQLWGFPPSLLFRLRCIATLLRMTLPSPSFSPQFYGPHPNIIQLKLCFWIRGEYLWKSQREQKLTSVSILPNSYILHPTPDLSSQISVLKVCRWLWIWT